MRKEKRPSLPVRMLSRMHGIASQARFSLTLRIAARYCVELLRTAGLAFCVLALFFMVREFAQIRRTDAAFMETVTESTALTDASFAEVLDVPWSEARDWRFRLSHLFPDGSLRILGRVEPVGDGETVVLLRHDLTWMYTWIVWGVLAMMTADMLRMVCFLRKHNRLDRTVSAPIREMTEKTAMISADNLSDRLQVEGTKNELRDLAMVINSMLDRLEVSYNSQKQFVSDASHELRTPIAVIQGYTDMLARWGKDDPQVLEEGIEAISQETASMKDLVEDLLFLARHDKKTLIMEMNEFDPTEVMQEVRRETEMVNPTAQLYSEAMEPFTMQADRNRVKQLMRILLDNAVKYSPDGAVIHLSLKKKGDSAVFTVRDEGQGISAEDMPKIFDRFYRSDAARKRESGGHGLGLSIARIIVLAHGGRIHVRSKPGQGTTFTIELPLKQAISGVQEVAVEEKPKKRPRHMRKAKAAEVHIA